MGAMSTLWGGAWYISCWTTHSSLVAVSYPSLLGRVDILQVGWILALLTSNNHGHDRLTLTEWPHICVFHVLLQWCNNHSWDGPCDAETTGSNILQDQEKLWERISPEVMFVLFLVIVWLNLSSFCFSCCLTTVTFVYYICSLLGDRKNY